MTTVILRLILTVKTATRSTKLLIAALGRVKQNRTILDSSETQNNKEALSNDSDVNENEIQVTVFDIHPEVDEPLHGSSETSDNTADRKLSPHTRDDQNCEVGLSDGTEPNNDSTTPFRGDVTLMEPK